jgi:tetratricopeptide (TPR) repeat protein
MDAARAVRLAALGYVGPPRGRARAPLPNPRDQVPLLARIRDGLRRADQKRYSEAVTTLRGVLAESPDMIDVWTQLADVYRRMGRLDDSAEAHAEALRRSPSPPADLVVSLGRAELARGRLEAAERHARAVNAGSHRTAGDLLLAEIALRRGDLAGALRILDEAERHAAASNGARVYRLEFLRGDALARLNRIAEAEAAYRREIERFPSDLQAYANLAVLQFLQGRRAAADATLEAMARANPGEAAHRLAATTWDTLGDRRAAAGWRARRVD